MTMVLEQEGARNYWKYSLDGGSTWIGNFQTRFGAMSRAKFLAYPRGQQYVMIAEFDETKTIRNITIQVFQIISSDADSMGWQDGSKNLAARGNILFSL